MIQALPTFPIHKTTIKELLTRSRHPYFVYGALTNRSNKIEGYFTHRHLLQYIEQQYDDLDDNPNNLQFFSRFVAKDFMIIHHESIPTAFPLHTTLLIIEQPAKTFGYIDERHFYQAVAQQQQIRTQHYDTIFDAMSSGLVAVNNEGIITMFNHAAEALYSLKHGEAMGKFLLDVSESDGLLRVLKTGKGHVEKYALQDRWFITYREPIYNGKQLIGTVSVFDDISKIESLTSELQLYKELVQENDALMANSEHGVGILDSKGTVLRENEQFHHFYVAILYNEQLRTKLFTLLQQVSHMQKPSYTTNFHLDDGRTLNLRFARIPDDAQKRIIIRIRDETTEYNFNVKAERLRNSVHHYFSVPYNERLVATTPDMQRVIEKIDSAAKGSAPVMILGEHGSGRSIIAAEIVRRSDRNDELFIEIDCMKESRERLEHLIFAKKHFSYYFIQVVKNGTLFFKNIDYLPLDMQKRLAQLIIHQSEREAAVNVAKEQFGQVDVLVNNAGWDKIEPFLKSEPATWETIMNINLMGQIHTCKTILPLMIEQGYGKVVNIASDSGRVGSSGEAVYSAAKGGVIALTKTLAREMARHKINVNVIAPGPADTPLFKEIGEYNQGITEALIKAIPFRRLAQPQDIANAVAFLASDEAEYITGQTLSVNGGLAMV